ncbi:MAG: hypothetical protein KDN20_15725 [Verrucomicrobiae bacterium]|nr:hypothetical protein [Verrucomicrobiae bacterium]
MKRFRFAASLPFLQSLTEAEKPAVIASAETSAPPRIVNASAALRQA